MNLFTGNAAMLKESGGMQEGSTYLGIPCLTLCKNAERPVTATEGSNRLLPVTELQVSLQTMHEGKENRDRRPDLWNGNTTSLCVVASIRRSGIA